MTFDASPSSVTDELRGPEEQGVSSAPAPVIDFTHRWDDNGDLLPGTSPSSCPTCHWNGDPEKFWDNTRLMELRGEDFMRKPINCVLCELFRCILFKRAELEGRQVSERSCIVGPGSQGFQVGSQFDDEDEDFYHSVFVSSDTPSTDIDRYNITRLHISSDDSLTQRSSKWAQERLAVCASTHELCKSQSGDSFLPTRLINLEPGWEGLDVRLESSSSVRPGSPYVALSYCWGDYRPACITTAETLAQNKTRIPWDRLPATFQDAAAFTLSLGLHYLWIDSICIIQEDEEDWQREAGTMFAVYKNSYLTLAALSGSSSTSGLRDKSMKQDSHLVAELRIAQNVCPVYIRLAHYLDTLHEHNIMGYLEQKALARRYPLLSRAWAYQERTVSPRVIFFTESEMVFQCQENVECECGATREWCRGKEVLPSNKTSIFLQTRSESDFKLKSRELVSVRPTALEGIRPEDRRDWEIAVNWQCSVVVEYSLLRITMPRDRLPALGAIAEQFKCVRTEEAYLAGLWSRSLLDDLLWICDAEQPSLKKSKAKLERPFSLPTWSWASLQCGVSYGCTGVSVPMAEILEANCSYGGGSEFGILQSSKLVLRGRILGSVLKWTHDHYGRPCCSFCVRISGDAWAEFNDQPGSNLRIYMDMDKDGAQRIPPYQEIYILEISEIPEHGDFSDSPSHSVNWHFLLLRREDLGGFVYTRAGIAIFYRRLSVNKSYAYKIHERQDGFERAFEDRSVLTTCEIR